MEQFLTSQDINDLQEYRKTISAFEAGLIDAIELTEIAGELVDNLCTRATIELDEEQMESFIELLPTSSFKRELTILLEDNRHIFSA